MNPFVLIVPAVVLFALLVPRKANAPLLGKPRFLLTTTIASPEITKRLSGEYPAVIAALAGKWGKAFGIPGGWLRSQAFVESRNVPTAINKRTGMYGVLQLQPATAEWLIGQLLKTTHRAKDAILATIKTAWTGKPEDLLNPDLNVMLAAYYMALLKKRFGDDHGLVAAAYCTGPNKIGKCLAENKPLPEQTMIYVSMVADAKRRGFN